MPGCLAGNRCAAACHATFKHCCSEGGNWAGCAALRWASCRSSALRTQRPLSCSSGWARQPAHCAQRSWGWGRLRRAGAVGRCAPPAAVRTKAPPLSAALPLLLEPLIMLCCAPHISLLQFSSHPAMAWALARRGVTKSPSQLALETLESWQARMLACLVLPNSNMWLRWLRPAHYHMHNQTAMPTRTSCRKASFRPPISPWCAGEGGAQPAAERGGRGRLAAGQPHAGAAGAPTLHRD